MKLRCRLGLHDYHGTGKKAERIIKDAPFVKVWEVGLELICAYCGKRGFYSGVGRFSEARREFVNASQEE